MPRTRTTNKFHYNNKLLKNIRLKASSVDKTIVRAARSISIKASKKFHPKSVLSKLSRTLLRRLISD